MKKEYNEIEIRRTVPSNKTSISSWRLTKMHGCGKGTVTEMLSFMGGLFLANISSGTARSGLFKANATNGSTEVSCTYPKSYELIRKSIKTNEQSYHQLINNFVE
jgi:hypothetical protein